MSWRRKTVEGLVAILLVAIATRISYELLWPILPALISFACLVLVLLWVLRGPHAR